MRRLDEEAKKSSVWERTREPRGADTRSVWLLEVGWGLWLRIGRFAEKMRGERGYTDAGGAEGGVYEVDWDGVGGINWANLNVLDCFGG